MKMDILSQLSYYISQIIEYLQKDYDNLPKPIKDAISKIKDIMKDVDTQNKEEVYNHIAKWISEKTNKDIKKCLVNWKDFIGEEQAGPLADNEIISFLADKLLVIKLHYKEVEKNHKWNRQIDIFFKENEKSVKYSVTEQLDWDNLPSEVRQENIEKNSQIVSYIIYPKKEEDL